MTKRYKLECLGDEVVMIVDKEKGVAFDGWDERSEMAFIGFGDTERSPCWIVARAIDDDKLDEALVDAAEKVDLPLVSALLGIGANATSRDSYALCAICDLNLRSDNPNPDVNSIIRALIEAGAEPTVYYNCALRRAVQTQDYDLMRFLFKKGARVSGDAFTDALDLRDMTAFYILLDNSATVEEGGNGALVFAITMRDEKIVSDLLKTGAGDNLSLEYPFIIAAQDGTVRMIEMLLEKDPSLMQSAPDAIAAAARLVAMRGGEHDSICYLLERMHKQGGIKYDPATKMGAAALRGDYSIAAEYLVDKYRI